MFGEKKKSCRSIKNVFSEGLVRFGTAVAVKSALVACNPANISPRSLADRDRDSGLTPSHTTLHSSQSEERVKGRGGAR